METKQQILDKTIYKIGHMTGYMLLDILLRSANPEDYSSEQALLKSRAGTLAKGFFAGLDMYILLVKSGYTLDEAVETCEEIAEADK